MTTIVHHAREGFLKIALAAALVAVAVPAQADELVVGALRDQDGTAVAGATVAAVDAQGRVLARDRSAADGTFALATPSHASTIVVTADDAEPLRLAVPADGTPLAGTVRRHRSADLVPSVADVAALPAGSLSAIGSVAPYRVAFPGSLSDRWLALGRGVTTVEGLGFYRRGDGGDVTSLLPAHATGGLGVRGALDAVWYGDRAGAGIVDARLFDRLDAARAAGTDGALALGRDPIVFGATSNDRDGTRRLVAARANGELGPVSATAIALLGDAPGAHYAGTGVELHAAIRRFDVGARFGLTSNVAATPLNTAGSVGDAVIDASGRGPNAIAVRVRWRDERAALGKLSTEHHDGALVLGTTRGNVARLTAAVALAYGDERPYDAVSRGEFAVLPSLALDAPLTTSWSLHLGGGVSTLGTPGFGIARAALAEAGIAYADRRRLRAELIVYSEGTATAGTLNRGVAASLGWEIAPRVSLRAWSMRDLDTFAATVQAYPGGPPLSIATGERFDRDVAWLTWDAPVRVDVLYRAGAIEGGLRVPLGGRYALSVGSYRRSDAKRALTLGLVAR